MKLKYIIGSIIFFAIIVCPAIANALISSTLVYESKLSTGKWAKISIPETGVYEITAEELAEMGFNDINSIKMFGNGGYVLDEVLSDNQPVDLSQIPITIINNKVVFYGNGSVKMSATSTAENPYYLGTVNPYSKCGCYFITDSDRFQSLYISDADINSSTEATSEINYSYDYTYHNNELFSFLNSGKTFFGENLLEQTKFKFKMPGHIADTPVRIAMSIGANVDAACMVSATINDNDVDFISNSIKKLSSNKEFEICSPVGLINSLDASNEYILDISLEDTGINSARLDYFSVTYQRRNEFPTDSTQFRMAYYNPSIQWNVGIKNNNETIAVWDVTNGVPNNQQIINETSENVYFRPTGGSYWEQYVAFLPSQTLKKVSFEGIIENQNLHGLSTPDMVIIYPKNFKRQAENLAEIHRTYDNMDVLIAEDKQIFNEFSSGVQDATAYRLFLKMLYDRNPNKLKHLLLLGVGSYDNRRLFGGKGDNQLLTYQSSDSNGTVSSFVTDDYFGFLADGSGKSIPTDILTISVGRIPAKTAEDAEAAISKTLAYITDNSNEVWKANALIISDKGDEDLHTSQAEALELLLNETMGGETLNLTKIYQEWYTNANIPENLATGTENWARDRFRELLNEGLGFVSYIGHAGSITITHDNRLWSNSDIHCEKYSCLPFFTLAACETAQYDGDYRSFSEDLILSEEGGAIGVLSAARTVYSSQNDKLNRAMVQYLFSTKSDGSYRTIGEASVLAKKSFGTTYNYNKLSFTLFGDPAVKFRFPVNRCSVQKINGQDAIDNTVTVTPLSKVTISGTVNNPDGSTDTSFNGTVTISIFDKEINYKTLISPNTNVAYDSKYSREKLCHTSGTVTNGVYNVTLTLPANCLASNDAGLIRIFAKSNDNKIVSGYNKQLIIGEYDENNAIKDNVAPIISGLYIDGQECNFKINTSDSPVINFTATDDIAINSNPNGIESSMKLIIDDGKTTISSLSNYTEVNNDGKTLSGSIQLQDLSTGKHTLKLEICDMAGNFTVSEAEFYVVGDYVECNIKADNDVVRDNATIEIESELDITEGTIHIQDSQLNTITIKEFNENSIKWDLCNSEGKRVKPGKYYVSAKFKSNNMPCLTNKTSIIVLPE